MNEVVAIIEDDGQPDKKYPTLTSVKGIKYQIRNILILKGIFKV